MKVDISTLRAIAFDYYFLTGKDYKNTPWGDLDVTILEGQMLCKYGTDEETLKIAADYWISRNRVEKKYKAWQIETKNEDIKIYSRKWFSIQTALMDTETLEDYLYKVFHIKFEDQIPEVLEIARQDILMRRMVEELRFRTAAPFRRALEKFKNMESKHSEKFEQAIKRLM